ncbi:MAG: imelysin family protein [Polaribacter sp.]|nr:imelysin family protein [Polaribacter sp.]
MKNKILLILVTLLIILACKNDEDNNVSTIDTFHQDYYNINISPAIVNFKSEIEKQIVLSERLKNDTSIENLNKLQEQWLISAKAFSKTKAYNVLAIKALYYDIILYNFPIKTESIENNIAEKTNYNSDYFRNNSTVSKGLGTLEYLLYNNQNTNTALSLLKENSYRIDYLSGVTEDVLKQTNLLINFWESEYKETFKKATSISCSENARCLAFNQLINILDIIRVTKIGQPAGLEGTDSSAIESLEAYRSESSLELIKSSIEEVQNAYTDSNVNFSKIVDEIADSSDASNAINNSFKNVFEYINAIDTSLYIAIQENNPNVELLYESLFDLVKYFSVDAASILSVTVFPTDNDGD